MQRGNRAGHRPRSCRRGCADIEASGWVRPHALAIDLAERVAAARVRDEALARLGHVDILVNNAGGSRPTTVDAPDGVWDESFAINFTAVRKLTQGAPTWHDREALGPHYQRHRNVGTGWHQRRGAGQGGCARVGQRALSQFARQIPLGYFGDPSDMAHLVAFLCSPKARYVTGERIRVDGGLSRAY